MCLYNKLIKNRKYTVNKKNGGNVPAVSDERVKYVPIGCGNCIECRKQEARKWQVRLLEDIKYHTNAKFITLTFSNESIAKLSAQITNKEATGYNLDNEIATKAVRLFFERWRKKYKHSMRHWLITEIGHNGTENIHLHGILWTGVSYATIESMWQYGFIWPRPSEHNHTFVNDLTINYVVKYVHKVDKLHPNYKPRILTSPGIGKGYVTSHNAKRNKFNGTETNELYITRTGHKIAMPTYWRNHLYSEEQRERLWLQRLDKNERWVCGEKIKADDNEGYTKLVEWHRRRNLELGYGTNEQDIQQEQYEKERRNLLILTRIQKAKQQ